MSNCTRLSLVAVVCLVHAGCRSAEERAARKTLDGLRDTCLKKSVQDPDAPELNEFLSQQGRACLIYIVHHSQSQAVLPEAEFDVIFRRALDDFERSIAQGQFAVERSQDGGMVVRPVSILGKDRRLIVKQLDGDWKIDQIQDDAR